MKKGFVYFPTTNVCVVYWCVGILVCGYTGVWIYWCVGIVVTF